MLAIFGNVTAPLRSIEQLKIARNALNELHDDFPYADHSIAEMWAVHAISRPLFDAVRADAILKAAALPTWDYCSGKHDRGEDMSPLETMIYFYENAGHESAELFREHLRLLLTDHINAATAPYME